MVKYPVAGPWKGQAVAMDKEWVLKLLEQKIETIDWNKAKQDVASFLHPRESRSVQHWNKEFFMHYLQKFSAY